MRQFERGEATLVWWLIFQPSLLADGCQPHLNYRWQLRVPAEQPGQAEPLGRWDKDIAGLRDTLWTSLAWVLAFLLAALGLAAMLGKIDQGLPFDAGKSCAVAGGAMACWATLFFLTLVPSTYERETLPEMLQPVVFKWMTLPALGLATLGVLWWT